MAARDFDDAFAMLRSIAAHPAIFTDVAADAARTAQLLVVKQIKSRASDLQKVREIRGALGAKRFGLILDDMADFQIKTLLVKLDKGNPKLKVSDPLWRRRRLGALVDGLVEPTATGSACGNQH
jgi:hypothetical protein